MRYAFAIEENVAARLWRIIDREMTIDEIEFEYVARHGHCNRATLLSELSLLEVSGSINRIKQGVYEP